MIIKNELNKYYNSLHKLAEISGKEIETVHYINSIVVNLKNFKTLYMGKWGSVYLYNGNHSSDKVDLALRTNIDALEFENIIYHGCGHDAHTASLIETARLVVKKNLCKNIIFIFQGSEEEGSGATNIAILLKKLNIFPQKIVGFHVTPDLYPKYISISPGNIMAAGYSYSVSINLGIQGHVGISESKTSSFIHILENLDEYLVKLSSNTSHVVITSIKTNGKHNITPNVLNIIISIRATDYEQIKILKKLINSYFLKIINNEKIKNVRFKDIFEAPNQKNDHLFENECFAILSKNMLHSSIIKTPFMFSSDDFSNYSRILKIPSTYFFVGSHSFENIENVIHTTNFLVPKETIYIMTKSLFLLCNQI